MTKEAMSPLRAGSSRCSDFSNALSSTASFFDGWRSTPGTMIGSHQQRWLQYPRRRPIASPLKVCGRRPRRARLPPS
jgi:hypothetical protein